MKTEKVENERGLRRKRVISMALYEVKRRLTVWIPKSKKKRKRVKFHTRQKLFAWKMLTIPIINFLIFWLYANMDAITMAFRNIDFSTGMEYWTLGNFKKVMELFTEGNMLLYGRNTLMFWLLSTVWAIPHSILLTYGFHKKLAGRKVFRVLLYIPSIICSVALAGIFSSFISSNGAIGYILTNVFHVARVPSWFTEVEYAMGGLLFYSFFFGFAGQYILYSGAMANVDTEITEAAYMDGVTMWQEIFYIDIPLMWPTLSMTIVTSFSGLFGASGPILIFTPYMEETYTFGYWIFDQVRRFQAYYLPATLGLCFTIIAFPIAMWVKKTTDKMFTTE